MLGGCDISLRGPLSEVIPVLDAYPNQDPSSASGFELVQPPYPCAAASASFPAKQDPLQASGPRASPPSRAALEQSFPTCPDAWLSQAKSGSLSTRT